MFKGIYMFFKKYYEKEIDYTIEFEFSIYDVIFAVLILCFTLWMILK